MNSKNSVFPLVGSIINVQAYKFDGTLYRQWNGVKVLRNTKQHYVLFMYKTQVAELNKRDWIFNEPVIWFMPKNSMYNCLSMLKPKTNYNYVNLSSRPIYEDNTIKFIDFDIDVKKYGSREILVVDGDEFLENSKKYKYPIDLKNKILEELDEILHNEVDEKYFFNKKVINYYIDLAKKDKSIKHNFRNTTFFAKRKFYNKKSN
ncbi:DUF402 domain-containing protein [Mycoplasma sp. Mirounga ES2805-ORL]|uniref:DUF402 domain-containing protein n=1 Tax=Mycoplasma sp. Mirounga ES2805-ORL TaxID=754514 RepID=UPI00197B66BB|nr:DUF402 domain-containing protein [Mycoplasma sp. Mirounga ES2805-ORL]QSF13401.1 DUF402 domain-containing protein [Mycoplasma sp. Mirounga ES2805-ORL]